MYWFVSRQSFEMLEWMKKLFHALWCNRKKHVGLFIFCQSTLTSYLTLSKVKQRSKTKTNTKFII